MQKTLARALIILSLVSTGIFSACGSNREKAETAGGAVQGVTVETVRWESTPDIYEAVGTIRSATVSVLGAQISGDVREIRVRPGDLVKRGQVLAVLDDRSPRAQVGAAQAGVEEASQGSAEVEQGLQAARAEREFAEATYRRYQALLDKNSVSRQEFDQAESRYKAALASERALEARKKQVEARGGQAKSQLTSAETQLSYSRITSPIDGIVTEKSVDEGTLVMPGTPILTVEDPGRYRLEASVPEQFVGKVRRGQEVSVSTGHGDLPGKVAEVVPAADASSRTFLIKVDLPRDCGCRTGEYAKANVALGSEKRLTVPREALIEHGQLEGLFVVDPQGAAEYRLVTTGKTLGTRVEILSGLAEGERVATSGLDRLHDGARVEIP